MNFLEQILTSAQTHAEQPALSVIDDEGENLVVYSYQELMLAASVLLRRLKKLPNNGEASLRIGLLAGNGPAWVVADLALLLANMVEVPMPLAFTKETAANLIAATDFFLVDEKGRARLQQWGLEKDKKNALLVDIDALLCDADTDALSYLQRQQPPKLVDWVCKIIHTSGTTNLPKGVKIRYQGLDSVLQSLSERSTASHHQRALSLVPLSLLIEQVSVVYMSLMQGGTLVFSSPNARLLGEKGISAEQCLQRIANAKASVLTLTPALVDALAQKAKELCCSFIENESAGNSADKNTTKRLNKMLFGVEQTPLIACGGAPVSSESLAFLQKHGVSIYEGYGLSENSSVVCWNSAEANRLGSVGKALSHVQLKLAGDGELLVKSSSLFAGYSQLDPSACDVDQDGWLSTGDIAYIDDDDFVFIRGRKKHVIITANGRNVSPEWLEVSLCCQQGVNNAVIVGDGLQKLYALVVTEPETDLAVLHTQLERYGREFMSDIERPDEYVFLRADDARLSECWTITGRPRRDHIKDLVISLTRKESEDAAHA
ncbi:AMP-binding protein [Agaribacterium haliotis]|uniref:AMP-binding protein n=1 Tax=Agaribacterium haliotis TaxID=2013869 RepID=UPI000BB556B0|nr:AMP-binding protein [Agaribacterium haliotis]